MIAGASWSLQLLSFAIVFAFGLASGVAALLFKRKARPIERALTDFFAVIAMGGLFLSATELGCDGQLRAFGIAAFLLGTLCSYKTILFAKRKLVEKRALKEPGKQLRKQPLK
jgi:hypothetical protein